MVQGNLRLAEPLDEPNLAFSQRHGFTSRELLDQTFPPLRFVVPGIVPEGLTLLAGPPKVGKSWLVLDIATAVAGGGEVLGIPGSGIPRPVLYFALEDGARRLYDRMRAIHATPADELEFRIRHEGDVLSEIREWIAARSVAGPMVILDTLGRVAPPKLSGETDYQRDYRVGVGFKQIVDDFPGSAILIVHHTRKADSDDFVGLVSGTNGLPGAADAILVLQRGRGGAQGSLSIVGRDLPDEGEFAATFKGVKWILEGNSLRGAAQKVQEDKLVSSLGDRSAEIVRIVNRHPDGIKGAEVAARIGVSATSAGTYLGRLERTGRIRRLTLGVYAPVESVESVLTDTPSYTDSTHSTQPFELELGTAVMSTSEALQEESL